MAERNRITQPDDPIVPLINIPGVPFPLAVVADLPEGAQIHFVNGENPVGVAVPGSRMAKGTMLVLIPPEAAAQIRPGLKQFDKSKPELMRRAGLLTAH